MYKLRERGYWHEKRGQATQPRDVGSQYRTAGERKRKRENTSGWMSDVSVAWHRIGEHWRAATQALQNLWCSANHGKAGQPPREDVTRRWCNLWLRFPIAGKHRGSHRVPKRQSPTRRLDGDNDCCIFEPLWDTARETNKNVLLASRLVRLPALSTEEPLRGWRHMRGPGSLDWHAYRAA
jgi:hypothetical protein